MQKSILISLILLNSLYSLAQKQQTSILFDVTIDSVVIYGPFKAFEPRQNTESLFYEKHLFVTYRIENISSAKIKLPSTLRIGVDNWDDIFYSVERYDDSLKKFVLNPKKLVLRSIPDESYQELEKGQRIVGISTIEYWISVNGENRIMISLNLENNNKNLKNLSTNWIVLPEAKRIHSIKVIRPYLPE